VIFDEGVLSFGDVTFINKEPDHLVLNHIP
jgi:hypothetical protein